MPTRKQINKGFYGFETDDAEFLKPSNTNPYEASASGVGYNASKDDDYGYDRGALGFTDDDPSFRRPSFTGDVDHAHQNLRQIVDDADGMGSGNKLTGGGGPLTKDYGVNDGRPRFASKAGNKVQNRDSKGGRDRAGGR
jgi:hypothetical protein